jgi:hypothetical protein
LILGALLASAGLPRSAPPEPGELASLAEARVKAAAIAYKEAWEVHREGRSRDIDHIYLWSLRWLDAEKDHSGKKADQLAATIAHEKRMKQLEDLTRARFRAGAAAPVEVPAAQYYHLEAKMLVGRLRSS